MRSRVQLREWLLRGALTVAGGVCLAGCFLSHSREDEAHAEDAGLPSVDASADGPCAPVGGYIPCDGECEVECRDLGRLLCAPAVGVCWPHDTVEELRGNDNCHINYLDHPSVSYCWSGNICAARPDPVTPGYPDLTEDAFAGNCVRPEYCDEVGETDIGAQCRYSDGSLYVNGPPEVDECPPGGNPLTPFCGGPCSPEGCPFTEPWHMPHGDSYDVSCVGMSETRGIGVCAIGTNLGCRPEEPGIVEACEFAWGEPCLCLVVQDDDGPRDWGWPTMADSCRAYRDMFPADFECFDEGWNLVD